MSTDFDSLTVTISGPLALIAKFQPLLEAPDGALTLAAAIGKDDGEQAVIRWSGRSAAPPAFGLRGPRRAKDVG